MCVKDCGISPDYFKEHLSDKEMDAILERNFDSYKLGWEQTRWQAYIFACTQSSNIKNPQDIMKFPWDEDIKSENTFDLQEALQRSNEMLEHINKNK